MTHPRALVCPLIVGLLCATVAADVRLPSVISDHMVLQRMSTAPIWGWADPGERVYVQADWMAQPVDIVADEEGRWRVDLETTQAGGPRSITIRGKNTITLKDILIGEVWVASGQSNMEMFLDAVSRGYHGVVNHEQEIAAARFPEIRLFNVRNTLALEPAEDCDGQWQACTPATVKNFSAVAYFFGRKLHLDLGVPVGLVGANWGGTPVEAWMNRKDLRSRPAFERVLAQLSGDDRDEKERRARLESAQADWNEKLDAGDAGLGPTTWFDQRAADESWPTMALPKTWESDELSGVDGVVWFRRRVTIPADFANERATLHLGAIDDRDVTWVNGVEVGRTWVDGRWQTPRRYRIPANLLKPGENVVAVRVLDTGGAGGLVGKPQDMKLVLNSDRSRQVSLDGDWRYKVGRNLENMPRLPRGFGPNSNTATVLYNGMIAPIIPFSIRGAIWYQGESNRLRARQYEDLFPAMIEGWRRDWERPDFPFYFVQIAPYRYGGRKRSAAELREAQRWSLGLRNTGMAVTMDVGNPEDIHPKKKRAVGERLARWALAKTYGDKNMVASGPLYRAMRLEEGRIRVFFDHVGGGLLARGGLLNHFEIAGPDRRFVTAKARIDGNTILVSSDMVQNPVSVRYGFTNDCEPNLFNRGRLPASPFRTDDW